MQYTIVTLATLFAAALGAPSDISPRQSVFTELAIYGDQGCANGRTGTDFITNQAGCQALSGNVVGAKVDIAIPAGCKIVFYGTSNCRPGPTFEYPLNAGNDPTKCFTLGVNGPIRGAIVTGTCV